MLSFMRFHDQISQSATYEFHSIQNDAQKPLTFGVLERSGSSKGPTVKWLLPLHLTTIPIYFSGQHVLA